MTLTRKLLVALSVIGVIALGFFREFIFIHINEQLFALWYDEPSRASDWIPFIKSVDYYTLYRSKWFLTVFFAGLFYGAILLVLRQIFDRWYWKELGVIYGVLFLAVAVALGAGYVLSNDLEPYYLAARFFMGIAQSPLLLMIMVPGIWLRRVGE